MALTIYKSSAGSGKTYTLVREYVKLLIEKPADFRHILAITFTNKATDEMKSRIISALSKLATGTFPILEEQLIKTFAAQKLRAKDIRLRATWALNNILHHYSEFNVSTIDSFFQQILRSFTKELKLPPRYEVEMNQLYVLDQITAKLLLDIGHVDGLTHWLEDFTYAQMDDDKGWHIERNIKDLGVQIFREEIWKQLVRSDEELGEEGKTGRSEEAVSEEAVSEEAISEEAKKQRSEEAKTGRREEGKKQRREEAISEETKKEGSKEGKEEEAVIDKPLIINQEESKDVGLLNELELLLGSPDELGENEKPTENGNLSSENSNPQSTNQEPRTKNQEPPTKNQEPSLTLELREQRYIALKGWIKELWEIKAEIEEKMDAYALEAMELISGYGLTIKDFKRGTATYFLKVKDREYEQLSATQLKIYRGDINQWTTKKSEVRYKIEQLVDNGLQDIFVESVDFYAKHQKKYVSATEVLRNIYVYGVLTDLKEKLVDYRTEENLMLISDTGNLIQSVVNESGLAFIFEKVGTLFKHILIDEFQDTSDTQWASLYHLVLNAIAADHKALIVGDVKQSIYRWRGGNMHLLLSGIREQMGNFFDEETELALDTNYRSYENIIHFNNAFFDTAVKSLNGDLSLPELTEKQLQKISKAYATVQQKVQHKDGGYINVQFLKDDRGGLSWKEKSNVQLLATIDDLVVQGFGFQDIAILVRRNVEGSEVAQLLGEKGIKVVSSESLLLKNSVKIRLLVSCLRYLADARNIIAKTELLLYRYQMLTKEERGEEAVSEEAISEEAKKQRSEEAVSEEAKKQRSEEAVSEEAKKQRSKEAKKEAAVSEEAKKRRSEEAVSEEAKKRRSEEAVSEEAISDESNQPSNLPTSQPPNLPTFDLHDLFADHQVEEGENSLYHQLLPDEFVEQQGELVKKPLYELVETLVRIFELQEPADAYIQRFQDLILEHNLNRSTDIFDFIHWWNDHQDSDETSIIVPKGEEAVTIMTVHKAKGLEFPVVIMPYAEWSFKPKSGSVLWTSTKEKPFQQLGAIPVRISERLNESYFAADYQKEFLNSFIDNLNNLYVAFTRPVQQLYVFTKKHKQIKAVDTVSKLLYSVFVHAQFEFGANWEDQKQQFIFGTAQNIAEKSELGGMVQLTDYFCHNYHEKITIRSDAHRFFMLFDKERSEAIKMGQKIHAVLEKLVQPDDLERVIGQMQIQGIIQAFEVPFIRERISKVFELPQVQAWFTDDWEVIVERPLLRGVHQYIPDRVMLKDNQAIVIDYKTVQPDTDRTKQLAKHSKQVNRYAGILGRMGYRVVGKYLLYIGDEVEVVAV